MIHVQAAAKRGKRQQAMQGMPGSGAYPIASLQRLLAKSYAVRCPLPQFLHKCHGVWWPLFGVCLNFIGLCSPQDSRHAGGLQLAVLTLPGSGQNACLPEAHSIFLVLLRQDIFERRRNTAANARRWNSPRCLTQCSQRRSRCEHLWRQLCRYHLLFLKNIRLMIEMPATWNNVCGSRGRQ